MSATGPTVPAFEHAFCIASDHPSLPGHFPGAPLVPGVIVLEQVAIALRAWRGERLARIVEAKFVAPLLPAQAALVRLTIATVTRARAAAVVAPADAPVRIRFEILRDTTVLARGVIEGAA